MSTTNRKPSRHLRGYGNNHEARRRQLEPLVATGRVACCRCGELIEPGVVWHLDHRDDRRGYLGPAHARCNMRAAAQKTNSIRRPEPLIWSRIWYEPVPSGTKVAGVVYGDNHPERRVAANGLDKRFFAVQTSGDRAVPISLPDLTIGRD